MLTLTIKALRDKDGNIKDAWDADTETFISLNRDWTIQLEHSLISIFKWESKWHKPYLSPTDKKTSEEILDYIKCMTVSPNVDPAVYRFLTDEHIRTIEEYINDPHTATWFNEKKGHNTPKKSAEILTAELIYYYMIANEIPWDAQKWHINNLLTLIRICGDKVSQNPKLSKKDILSRNASLNKARRMALGSKG